MRSVCARHAAAAGFVHALLPLPLPPRSQGPRAIASAPSRAKQLRRPAAPRAPAPAVPAAPAAHALPARRRRQRAARRPPWPTVAAKCARAGARTPGTAAKCLFQSSLLKMSCLWQVRGRRLPAWGGAPVRRIVAAAGRAGRPSAAPGARKPAMNAKCVRFCPARFGRHFRKIEQN